MRKRPMVELPPHVHRVVAKGRDYFYFQRNRGAALEGPRIALPRDLHSIEFWQAYRAAGGQIEEAPGRTFKDLITAYRVSPEFRARALATQRDYERYLKIIVVALREVGCGDRDIESITGMSPAMITRYSRFADQRQLAKAAILRLERNRT